MPSGSASPASWMTVAIVASSGEGAASDRSEQEQASADLAETHHGERRRRRGEGDAFLDEQGDQVGGGGDHGCLFEDHGVTQSAQAAVERAAPAGARPACRRRGRAAAGSTTACSRAVNSPPPTPSTASAWRQPSASTSQAPSGAKTVRGEAAGDGDDGRGCGSGGPGRGRRARPSPARTAWRPSPRRSRSTRGRARSGWVRRRSRACRACRRVEPVVSTSRGSWRARARAIGWCAEPGDQQAEREGSGDDVLRTSRCRRVIAELVTANP